MRNRQLLESGTRRSSQRPKRIVASLLLAAFAAGPAADFVYGQKDEESQSPTPKSQPEIPMKPTSVGVRFTPQMAQAISKMFTKEMTTRYELDKEQAEACRKIIGQQ